MSLIQTTYSMWSRFRNCRKACEFRYIKELVPLERDKNLAFGSVIHDCLEIWHGQQDITVVLEFIDGAYPDRNHDEKQRANWHLATAMMTAYAKQFPTENFEVIALEKTFEGPIINPITGAASRSFSLAGKVDGIVKQDGLYYLLEHKTAAQINSGYLERLWTDFQIILYAWYLEQTMGIFISGIIYNILVKAKLRQSIGETEAEFETRRAGLISKSKTGKSSAKRKMPESDDSFQARLLQKYEEPGMFHREELFISRDQFAELQEELWELSQAMLNARRRNFFYRNTSNCFQYNRPCAYFPLCRSGDNPNVIENYYQKVTPNEELRTPPVTTKPPTF
jgi:hypothetical protein